METPVERKRRLARERKRRQRARQKAEEKAARRAAADARYRSKKLSCETLEETEMRKAKSRFRQAKYLANDPEEKAEKRRAYVRRHQAAEQIANEMKDEAERRYADMHRRQAEQIVNETENTKAKRIDAQFRAAQLLQNEYVEGADFSGLHRTLLMRQKRKLIKPVTVGYKTESLTQTYQNEPEIVSRLKPTSEILSSTNSLIQNDSSSHPTAAKLQKKSDRQFGNQYFGERRQMAFAQSPMIGEPCVRLPSQTQMQQHLQMAAPPPPAPVPPAPRQVQMLTPPVQVAKPKPVEKPRPQEKRIFVVADHQRCVMSNLSFLWKNKKLCDAGIGNGMSTVMVHKVVLSAVCPKLLSVFSTDVLSQKFLQVNFPEEVSTEALNAFAEYMYNGILDLDPDILEQLKIIAKRLDMKEFEQLCDSHLPNHIQQPVAAAASFANVPMIQTTMPISAMASSFSSTNSTVVQSAPSITAQVVDVKREITEADLDLVKKEAAAVFGRESEVVSLAPNKSGNAAGIVICPSVKTEPVGLEDDRYGQVSNSSSNQVFSPTTSSSLATATAASSISSSSTEFTNPFSQSTDTKSTKLQSVHSYQSPIVSDLSPVSCIVETMCSQSNPMGVNSSKSLNWLPAFKSSTEGPSTNDNEVYPLELYTAEGDNMHLFNTAQVVNGKNINSYKMNIT